MTKDTPAPTGLFALAHDHTGRPLARSAFDRLYRASIGADRPAVAPAPPHVQDAFDRAFAGSGVAVQVTLTPSAPEPATCPPHVPPRAYSGRTIAGPDDIWGSRVRCRRCGETVPLALRGLDE